MSDVVSEGTCDCGDCRTCRRAMGLTPQPVKKVELSESTRRLLAQLDEPKPKPRPTAVRRPRPVIHRSDHRSGYCRKDLHRLEGDNVIVRNRPDRVTRECKACAQARKSRGGDPIAAKRSQEKPQPRPCRDCGHMIGAHFDIFKGWVLAGADGVCEVCRDRPVAEAWLAKYAELSPEERKNRTPQATRYRRLLQRTLRDGRAFHEDAPHGVLKGYMRFGCRCEPCRAWKSRDNAERRHRDAA